MEPAGADIEEVTLVPTGICAVDRGTWRMHPLLLIGASLSSLNCPQNYRFAAKSIALQTLLTEQIL